jgi:hypothetical protein
VPQVSGSTLGGNHSCGIMITPAETAIAVSELGTVAVRALEQLQDFQAFSGHSYDRYGKMIVTGHIEETITNVRTNSNVSGKDLAALLLTYLDNDLPRVVLYQAVSHFEAFFFDLLGILLQFNPQALSQKRQVTVGEVLDASDYKNLLETLIGREVIELQYKAPSEWFAFLRKIINLGLPDGDVARLAELKATRDLHLHNRGVVNDIYLRKSGPLARGALGSVLPVSRPYVYDGVDFLKRLTDRLCAAARDRLVHAA